MSRPLLFADRGCPYAQRVLALVRHLDADVECQESVVGEKPVGVFSYSSRGAIPMLVHDGLVFTESRVMLEHLAEYFRLSDALPAQLNERSLHRHTMAVADGTLARWLFAPGDPDVPSLEDACRALSASVAIGPLQPSLLALHVAPMWIRYRLFRPRSAVVCRVEATPSLAAWLDDAASLPCIQDTLPDRGVLASDLRRAHAAGLIPVLNEGDWRVESWG